MPNWCSNRVRVCLKEGDNVEDMKEFKELVKGENGRPFSFNSIIPMPEELHTVQSPVRIMTEEEIEEYKKKHSDSEWMIGTLPITKEYSDELLEKYGDNNWYDWCINNWGVKWDCADGTITEEFADLELTYTFDTPWGPPQEIYDVLTAKFPNLRLTWFWDEPGCEQAGYLQ